MSTPTMNTHRKHPVGLAGRPARRSFGKWFATTGWRHLIGVLLCIYAAVPLLYVLSASLNPNGTLLSSNGFFTTIGFESFEKLFNNEQRPFAAWFGNTLLIGLVTSVASVFLGALAAYCFSRMRFKGRRFGLVSLLVVQIFPQLLAVVAIFILLTTLGDVFPMLGIDNQLALIMVYLGGALGVNTYLMYGFFNTIPVEIDEAAKLDGAGHARIFFTMILRLVAPILAVVGLLTFISTTSDFVIASVVLVSPENQTLAVGLYSYVSEEFTSNWSVFAAGAVLAALPVMALFLFLQKYIVGGLTAGASK